MVNIQLEDDGDVDEDDDDPIDDDVLSCEFRIELEEVGDDYLFVELCYGDEDDDDGM